MVCSFLQLGELYRMAKLGWQDTDGKSYGESNGLVGLRRRKEGEIAGKESKQQAGGICARVMELEETKNDCSHLERRLFVGYVTGTNNRQIIKTVSKVHMLK